MIPFTRPTIGDDEIEAATNVLKSGWITTGPKVSELERALEAYLNVAHVRLFNSATSALEAVLLAHGIGPGDEVIVPAMSFVATANVVVRCGARPIFVDVDLHSRNIDVSKIEPAITSATRAIIPVHFAGLAVALSDIHTLAARHGLLVLEDAAQAIGTRYGNKMIGASGNPVCFSFHPNKNMTTIEGGAVASSDPNLTRKIEQIRFHGILRDSEGNMDVPAWGGKMNLPDVNAAIGLVQLRQLDSFNSRRHMLARRYLQHLPEHPSLVVPADDDGHSWHMFCICLDFNALGLSRSVVQKRFADEGITVGMHYPAIPAFSLYGTAENCHNNFPVAARIGEQTITLPLFPGMTEDEVDTVCSVVRAILAAQV